MWLKHSAAVQNLPIWCQCVNPVFYFWAENRSDYNLTHVSKTNWSQSQILISFYFLFTIICWCLFVVKKYQKVLISFSFGAVIIVEFQNQISKHAKLREQIWSLNYKHGGCEAVSNGNVQIWIFKTDVQNITPGYFLCPYVAMARVTHFLHLWGPSLTQCIPYPITLT